MSGRAATAASQARGSATSSSRHPVAAIMFSQPASVRQNRGTSNGGKLARTRPEPPLFNGVEDHLR
jgi:hypothetical protein